MSTVLGVSRSAYYKSIKSHIGKRVREDAQLLRLIKAAYAQSRMTYGSPRIHATLKDEGIICSQKRVAKLMRDNQIISITKKKFRYKSKTNSRKDIADNKLQQNFKVEVINKAWASDITYISTQQG